MRFGGDGFRGFGAVALSMGSAAHFGPFSGFGASAALTVRSTGVTVVSAGVRVFSFPFHPTSGHRRSKVVGMIDPGPHRTYICWGQGRLMVGVPSVHNAR